MAHVYFIAYEWTSGNSHGIGNGEVIRNKPLFSFKDIEAIQLDICKDKGVDQCIITNYIELDRAMNEGVIKRLLARRY